MPLAAGARLGPYEIVAPIGAGGMSACGYAELRTVNPRRGIGGNSRRGWGPAATTEPVGSGFTQPVIRLAGLAS